MMSQAFKTFNQSLLSVAKLLIQSRRSGVKRVVQPGSRLIVMGNGPSLRDAIAECPAAFSTYDCMAVNFAANTPEFFQLKPKYYTIADPHFYRTFNDANVEKLFENMARVDWPMTLFVPSEAYRAVKKKLSDTAVKVVKYNAIGIEGWNWFKNMAYDCRCGMPRPRNVLIPSIMIGIWLGYDELYITGADHSWTRYLGVDDENRVITNLPHFYADNDHEQDRVKAVYANVPLHELFLSYHVAFKAYHEIARWARRRRVTVKNVTKGSFIDAFERGLLQSIL